MKPQGTRSDFPGSPKEFPLKDLTGKIISCAISVHSILGPGLLESVYEEAMSCEFELRGFLFERQRYS